MKIPIELLDTESGTQARAMLNMDTVREYAEAMEGGAQFPPLVVFRDENDNMYVADGFHRAKAAIMIDLPELDCDVRAGDRRSAILHAVGANADHGLPRTIADKRAAVMRMLDDQEWGKRNDWQISQQCCVSAPFVKAVREKRQVAEDAPPDVPHDLREDWADVADKGGDPMVMTDPDKGKVVVDADEHQRRFERERAEAGDSQPAKGTVVVEGDDGDAGGELPHQRAKGIAIDRHAALSTTTI